MARKWPQGHKRPQFGRPGRRYGNGLRGSGWGLDQWGVYSHDVPGGQHGQLSKTLTIHVAEGAACLIDTRYIPIV